MKANVPFTSVVLALMILLITASCASKPKADWNSRVGNYTHDQAVVELGPPDGQVTLNDGGNVSQWIVGRSGGSGLSVGFGGYRGNASVGVSQNLGPGPRDKILRLTFSPDGKLTEWSRN
jgi:hypothetical protein